MKILSICGSPRKGNSEAILLRIQQLLKEKGIDNEIVLLREKKITPCGGCVEYCNQQKTCQLKDDMQEIGTKMEQADGYVFISPNYFQMPTGLFKDFIDRCSIFYTQGKEAEFKKKKAIVICVGADEPAKTDVCTNIIADNFCQTMGLPVIGRKSFKSHSELKGNDNDIFESGLNPTIEQDLVQLIESLC